VPAEYRYRAVSPTGELVAGSMQARDRETVAAALRSRALSITAIRLETRTRRTMASMFSLGRPRRQALLAFFRSFATLLRAGVAMRRALTVTIERSTDVSLQEALRSVLAEVERGVSLSDALSTRPRLFPALHVAMIRAGERGGVLDEVIERVAVLLERDTALVKKLRTALAYPAIVLTTALGLVVFLVARIVPMFAAMFANFNVPIPVPTRVLLALSGVLQSPILWLAVVGATVAAGLAIAQLSRVARGRELLDQLRFRVPLAGALARKATLARIARMLGTLSRSGVDLLAAIEAVAPVAASPIYHRLLVGSSTRLRAGEPLSAPLGESPDVDPLLLALIRVGEETGALDDMLLKAADYFESDVESALAIMSATIEPALVIVLGILVGSIVFSIFLPLYSLIGSLAK